MPNRRPTKKGAPKAAPTLADLMRDHEKLRADLDAALEGAHEAFGEMYDTDSALYRRAAVAFDKIDPKSREAISALMKFRDDKVMQVLLRFNDALYYECERAELAPTLSRKGNASKGGVTKKANDPKQIAKAGALQLWMERHEGKHAKLRTVQQFAIEVMRRWPVLTSIPVIATWSAKWTRDVREGRTPSC